MATARPATGAPVSKTATRTVAKPVGKTAGSPPARPARKPVEAAKPPSAAPAKAEKKTKPEKVKVVRDSFTIPKNEYATIAELKKRALAMGVEVKKSELIRAGLMLLAAGADTAFAKALSQVPALKTGRPGKN